MSSTFFGGGGVAGVARIAFEAETGEASRDIERFERRYRDSAGELSDAAIKVELSQRRLQRTLRDGPRAYERQARAELQLRNAERELRQETDRLAAAKTRQTTVMGRLQGRATGLTAGFGGLRGSVGALGLSFLGAGGLTYALTSAIDVASSLDEEISKSRQTFGGASRDVERFASTTSRSLGIAEDEALRYTGTLGGIFNVSGLVRAESARLGIQFVQLGGDMASFNNASPADTLEAIRAGLVGEYEPLRRYQVLLSEARVTQEAFRQTGKRSKDELTDTEKVLARVSLIMGQTARQQGDAARTGGQYAGQTRRLNAELRDLQGSVGKFAIPAVTGLVEWLNTGTGAANDFADALGRIGSVRIPGADSALGSLFRGLVTRTGPIGAFTNTRDILRQITAEGISNDEYRLLKQAAQQGQLGFEDLGLLRRFLSDERERELTGIIARRQARGRGGPDSREGARGPGGIAAENRRREARDRPPPRTLLDIEVDISRALTTPGTSDEEALYREQLERFERQIRNLERRERLTEKQKQELRTLYGSLASAQSSLDAIEDAEEARIDAQREAAAEKRRRDRQQRQERARRAVEAEERRQQRAFDEFERRTRQRDLRRAGDALSGFGGGAGRAAVEAARNLDRDSSSGGGLTEADVRRLHADFLTGLQGITNQFGSNFTPDGGQLGRMSTYAAATFDVLLEQNRLLDRLTRSAQHPGAKFAKTEAAVAFGGISSLV